MRQYLVGDVMTKIRSFFNKLMQGRYGADLLTRDMTWFALGLVLISALTNNRWLNSIGLILLLLSYIRMFSKNINARYKENIKYNKIRRNIISKVKRSFIRIKDLPKYKYLRCPSCNKQLRIPRGKKNIVVTCPACRHKFDA